LPAKTGLKSQRTKLIESVYTLIFSHQIKRKRAAGGSVGVPKLSPALRAAAVPLTAQGANGRCLSIRQRIAYG